jgi:1,3-beta-galactosyl-N-acetylhexosamine phosphorylase
MGYGGYLKLALQFPDFVDYVANVCDEFRSIYSNIEGTKPYCFARVAVLNAWGKMRAWGCHMVHHALYQKQNYSYAGVIEILSGAPVDVSFISFEDILQNADILKEIDVIVNVGDMDTAHTGGDYWKDKRIATALRSYIADGGGFIGVGEPSGHQWQGRTLQLAAALGVEKENGFTLGYNKYNWEEKPHFITEGLGNIDFGESAKNIYALEGTDILVQHEQEVQLAVNSYFDGRCVYIAGLPYSPQNARLLLRAVLWSRKLEDKMNTWCSSNANVDVHYYPESGTYCICNNSSEAQSTIVYTSNDSFEETLDSNEIRWCKI